MGGQGAVGAWGLAGLQDAIRQRLADQLKQRQIEQEMQLAERRQKLAESELEMRGKEHAMGLANSADARAWQQHVFDVNEGRQFNESIPGGTQLPATNPIVGQLRMGGAQLSDVGFPAQEPPASLAAPDQGPPQDMPGTIASSPMMSGRLVMKGASANQQNTLADNARADLTAKNSHEDRVAAAAAAAEAKRQAAQDRADSEMQRSADRENLMRLAATLRAPAAPSVVVVQGPDGPQLVDKRTGVAATVKDAAGNDLGQAPTSQERNTKASYKRARPILQGVSDLSEKINTGQGVLAKAQGAAAQTAAKLNLNDDVAEYEAMISGFTPLIARALGHTGVLTQQDVDSVKALFPRPGDSKTLRDRKVARIEQLMGAMEHGGDTAPPPGGGAEEWTRDASGKLVKKGPQ